MSWSQRYRSSPTSPDTPVPASPVAAQAAGRHELGRWSSKYCTSPDHTPEPIGTPAQPEPATHVVSIVSPVSRPPAASAMGPPTNIAWNPAPNTQWPTNHRALHAGPPDTADTNDISGPGKSQSPVVSIVSPVSRPQSNQVALVPNDIDLDTTPEVPSEQPLPYPAEWLTGVQAMVKMKPPDGFPEPEWAKAVAAAQNMLDRHGAELHRLGWTALNLFGLHPVAPYNRQDAKGLVFLLGGRNLKCIGSNVADIVVMSTQTLQTFTRHDHPDAVLAWEWPLLKNI